MEATFFSLSLISVCIHILYHLSLRTRGRVGREGKKKKGRNPSSAPLNEFVVLLTTIPLH